MKFPPACRYRSRLLHFMHGSWKSFSVKVSSTHCDVIRPGSSQLYQTEVLSASISYLEIGRNHRVSIKDSTAGGERQPFCVSPWISGWRSKCETGLCHYEAASSVLAKIRGDFFASFQAVAAKLRSRTRNSQRGLLGTVLCDATTGIEIAAPVWNIWDTTSYTFHRESYFIIETSM
jgi:hypothetical protein